MRAFPGIKEDPEVIGALVRKLSEKDRLQEALSLLDEAASAGLRIRERSATFFYSLRTLRIYLHTVKIYNSRFSGISESCEGASFETGWRSTHLLDPTQKDGGKMQPRREGQKRKRTEEHQID